MIFSTKRKSFKIMQKVFIVKKQLWWESILKIKLLDILYFERLDKIKRFFSLFKHENSKIPTKSQLRNQRIWRIYSKIETSKRTTQLAR